MATTTTPSVTYEIYNPHATLGLHQLPGGRKVIRLLRPGAKNLFCEIHGERVPMNRVDPAGLFELEVPLETTLLDYRVFHQNGLLAHDPYAFWPTFGEMDQHLFSNSVHYDIYRKMGGRLMVHQGVEGVAFTVWAPSALSVALVGDFNYWDGRANPMRSLGGCGIWELFVPGLKEGDKYKFEIRTQEGVGAIRVKADPYALSAELRPKTASVVATIDGHQWNDAEWMEQRARTDLNRPICIYEVHLGSWKKHDGHFLNYRELAEELAAYCNNMHFTHVELLPISEHPLDESWGYQVSGFYAVTSRYGTPGDFQYFVDYMHQHGIGVLIDWVPGHFPTDEYALAQFDGTCLYEHRDPRQGFHPHWQTAVFNFGRKEVSQFLIGSALLWLDAYHIDGLRVDAVASMLYLDYGRNEGEWIPNQYGGKENLDAIELLKHVNSIVHERFPGVLMVAEESTSFTGVSHPLSSNGLGFDLKWNMGWMNDTLRYMAIDPFFRNYNHSDLTFGMLYAFSERFALVLSHDEVVHGKRSLLSKMPGDPWQRFANLRLLYAYMICEPGKKLLFMGGEIGEWDEWWCARELQWFLLNYPAHSGLQACMRDLNGLYLRERALWDDDFSYRGFEWVDFHDVANSVISFRRKAYRGGVNEELLCVLNFTPTYHDEYLLHLPGVKGIEELFNTDDQKYGGSGKAHLPVEIVREGVKLKLAPLAAMIYRIRW